MRLRRGETWTPARAAVLAAVGLDAAAGMLAWVITPPLQVAVGASEGFFAACALAAGLSHGVLLPGLVWATGPVAPGMLAYRVVVAACALIVAVPAGLAALWAFFAVQAVGLWLFPALVETTSNSQVGAVLMWGPVFTAGGAAAGFESAMEHWAERLDPGPVPAWVPIAGGVAGVWAVLGFTALHLSLVAVWGARPVLAVVAPVVGGLPHVLLVAWAMGRGSQAGQGWPPTYVIIRRVAWCCGGLCVLAMMAQGLGA